MNAQKLKSVAEEQLMIPQAEYAKKLRPLLPSEAFEPDPSKLAILGMNLLIVMGGWAIGSTLDRWNVFLLWLYLPIALVMGNSIIVLLFSSHNLMHGSVIRNKRVVSVMSFLGLSLLWMTPTMWKAVHNREHHNKTNSMNDPDRNYLENQPKTWGKWIQNLFVPSAEVHPFWLAIGMTSAWGVHNFRNITSVLFFNNKAVDYVPAAFTVSRKERRAIAVELLGVCAIHLTVLFYLQFHPIKLLLSYFLPIAIGYAGAMFYIYTNHMISAMSSINDPMLNSLSIRVPKLFDWLHLNFSYHTEHHIFPHINSDYYPLVRELLELHYPGRLNLLDATEAWRLLLQTPRHYKDENTFTDWAGEKSVACPLPQNSPKL
ncbi:fatty acid desaturase family protein [Phormidium sp. CCY1219]|uniref:fatty acid desaturase family protein n=1 Tax=Phormidium sp. CCY1219 TaxID=2886104 RepID=UPI002D1F2DA7|nr:fatty acid desaturase [Phormidium sp. CCY1219]MEB3830937.1 fatty acid desaturase [Phormidium sp. CCY1219]